MEEQWRCPFCEALHAWPLDVADILDGRRPYRNYTPASAGNLDAVTRVKCPCGARAAVKGLAHSPLPPRPGPILDAEGGKHSRIFAFSRRPVVYKRTNATAQMQALAIDWVR
jgi:hypothetical protein